MTPEEYADVHGVDYNGETSEKGVFFAEFEDGDETFFMLVTPDGNIDGLRLEQIGFRGNYTTAVVEGELFERMVDDIGVHERISAYC